MAKKRGEVKKEDKWNVEAMFATDELWEKEHNLLKKDINNINNFRGKLKDSEKIIKEMIEIDIELNRRLDLLYTYAHMRHD